ncbi:MAG: hypothetical protein IJW13_06355 [Clostridia bacterium]|nr:hypothetical protein [Clostridia bacterium]
MEQNAIKFENTLELNNVIEIARATKIRLLEEWKANGYVFKDNQPNVNGTEGILYHSVGAVSIFLLMTAFHSEERVFPAIEKGQLSEYANKILEDMFARIEKEGYTAFPYATEEENKKIFGVYGYVDTITWVLSTCVLARYAERNGVIDLSANVHERVFKLIAENLHSLLDAQRKDGSWGFRAEKLDKGGKVKAPTSSLYFTYAVNASLADFFNYVLGEIEEVEEANEENKKTVKIEARDQELIDYLNGNGGFDNVEDQLNLTRKNVRTWILEKCLPLLPKVASCTPLESNENESLGVDEQSTKNSYSGINYFNLYYTYFILDLIVDSGADKYYEELCEKNSAEFERLIALYDNNENKFLSDANRNYFFSEGKRKENAPKACKEFMAQAIHSSRYHYMNAARTGKKFWDGTNSELAINWNHDDYDIDENICDVKHNITEPALIPMALRVNIQYCYYITEQVDATVDDLFKKIMDDRGQKNEGKVVSGLWDTIFFNLFVTERSIEALIDSYDYVRKFAGGKKATQKVEEKHSEIDNAITALVRQEVEKSISAQAATVAAPAVEAQARFTAEDIQQMVKNEVAKAVAKLEKEMPTQKASAVNNANFASVQSIIENLQYFNEVVSTYSVPRADGDENEQLAYTLINLHTKLVSGYLKTLYAVKHGEINRVNSEQLLSGDLPFYKEVYSKASDGAENSVPKFEKAIAKLAFNAINDLLATDDDTLFTTLYSQLKNTK